MSIGMWTEEDNLMLWVTLNNFKMTEAWGNPNEMHPLIMFMIDNFRSVLPNGCWIKIHCGFKEGGHTKNSFHYKGRAIDFHVVGCSFLEAERHFMRFLKSSRLVEGKEVCLLDYVGIGIYPDWNDPGFHLDIRGKKANWARVEEQYVAYEVGIEKARKLSL